MKTLRALLLALIPAIALASSTFNIFNPGPSGLIKSNGTATLQAATTTDYTTLFGCGGSSTKFLNGAGGCTVPAGGGGSSAITCTTVCSASSLAVGQELWMYKGTATNYTTQVGTGDGDLQITNIPIGDYFITVLLNVTGPTSGTLQGNFLDAGTTNGASPCQLMLVGGTMVQTGINTGSFSYQPVGPTGATGASVYTCSLLQVSGVSNKAQFFFFNSLASQTSTVTAGSWIRVERVL